MRANRLRNLPASVRQRLLNLSRERGVDFNSLLTRYGNERLLYRLARSRYHDQFVLKGAMLFETWSESPHRATRDVDLLGFGDPTLGHIEAVFRELCTVEVEPDGIRMLEDTVRAEDIRDQQEYGGVRVRLVADLGGARIPLQVDIGFGDVVVPKIEEADFPTLLDSPAPHLRTYPREAVVAEKFEAMVSLGVINTRMKDFYDLWELARSFPFAGDPLSQAIAATFARRGTPLPSATPVALSAEFTKEPAKQQQWAAFLRRTGLPGDVALHDVAELLRRFLVPPALAAAGNEPFRLRWLPGGDWSPVSS